MRLSFWLKHHFFGAFREFFVHHHGSLEFRAKLFGLMIAANTNSTVDSYIKMKEIALDIYQNDEERANLLMIATKEKVDSVKNNNDINIDTLISRIQQDLKIIPRYAKKINIEALRKFLVLTYDDDILCYQENILEFLQTLKEETLQAKKQQIDKDELAFHSQFTS